MRDMNPCARRGESVEGLSMRRASIGVWLSVTVAATCAAALLLSACAATPPALRTNLADGAKDVRIDTPLEVTAVNAKLEKAMLERVDVVAPPVELDTTD